MTQSEQSDALKTPVVFSARIDLCSEDWKGVDFGDVSQAVQNAIGHTGAIVIEAQYREMMFDD